MQKRKTSRPWQPEQTTLLLRLPPRGSSRGEFASLTLQAAPAAEQQRAEAHLATNDRSLSMIEQEARAGRSALAFELVFTPIAEPTPELMELRQELRLQGCGAETVGG